MTAEKPNTDCGEKPSNKTDTVAKARFPNGARYYDLPATGDTIADYTFYHSAGEMVGTGGTVELIERAGDDVTLGVTVTDGTADVGVRVDLDSETARDLGRILLAAAGRDS
jgi:hypothetical protein